jgi:hypothetical protein
MSSRPGCDVIAIILRPLRAAGFHAAGRLASIVAAEAKPYDSGVT